MPRTLNSSSFDLIRAATSFSSKLSIAVAGRPVRSAESVEGELIYACGARPVCDAGKRGRTGGSSTTAAIPASFQHADRAVSTNGRIGMSSSASRALQWFTAYRTVVLLLASRVCARAQARSFDNGLVPAACWPRRALFSLALAPRAAAWLGPFYGARALFGSGGCAKPQKRATLQSCRRTSASEQPLQRSWQNTAQ